MALVAGGGDATPVVGVLDSGGSCESLAAGVVVCGVTA